MSSVLIRNARLVNEGHEFDADLLVDHGRIVKYVSLRSRNGENECSSGVWAIGVGNQC